MAANISISNREIANLLYNVASAYQAIDENRFKIIAYEKAADTISQMNVELTTLWEKGRLSKLPAIGPSIAGHLEELFKTGKVRHFEAIFRKMPHGMMHLLKLSKVGGKTAYKLALALNKQSPLSASISDQEMFKHLKKAIDKGIIDKLPGFGPKKSAELLDSIAQFQLHKSKEERILLPVADEAAHDVVSYILKLPSVEKIDALGSLRRKMATIGDIDIAAATKKGKEVIDHFVSYPHAQKIVEQGKEGATIQLSSGINVDLRIINPSCYGSMLQYFTGSKQHNIALREYAQKKELSISEYGIKDVKRGILKKFSDEKKFYEYLGFAYIPPELRENTGELELAKQNKLPNLVTSADIKGDLHIHSDFDLKPSHDLGVSTMAEILEQANNLGYEYIGISDHNPKQSELTHNEVNAIMKIRKDYFENKKYDKKSIHNFSTVKKVFIMLEIDIKPNGELALPDASFSYIDAGIASIHSSFAMPKDEMTKRLLYALSHPKVKILGHPTGRLINRREGIVADWDVIFRFCKEKNIALEVNSYPLRLDLPDMLVKAAILMGVKLVINTDAHAESEMNLIKYGVDVARRGWATKSDIMNAKPLDQFEKWLKNGGDN